MKTLTLKVPDQLYEEFEQTAARDGRPVDALALECLARYTQRHRAKPTTAQRRPGLARLMRFAGSVSTGDPHSSDNERIDADLAREYANNHEDEP